MKVDNLVIKKFPAGQRLAMTISGIQPFDVNVNGYPNRGVAHFNDNKIVFYRRNYEEPYEWTLDEYTNFEGDICAFIKHKLEESDNE